MPDVFIQADVITTEVDHLLRSLEETLTGPKLLEFLQGSVHEYLKDDIVTRFAYEGDRKSGDWLPLSEATANIRQSYGFPGENPINERTGELLNFLYSSFTSSFTIDGAEITVPGPTSDTQLEHKLQVAQNGESGGNPLFPNSVTPPRPVLAGFDETDSEELLILLSQWILTEVNMPGSGI